MTPAEFEKSSLNWQSQQFGQRVSEWLELQLSGVSVSARLPNWQLSSNTVVVICWLLLGAIALWLGWQLIKTLAPYLRQVQRGRGRSRSAIQPEPQHTAIEWLQRAQQQQQQGNYRDACRSLYMAMLQRLHETQQISIEASRTDGEWLQQVQQLPQPQPYQMLIQTHEQACFSSATISAELFNRCQQAYQEIERRTQPGALP